MSDSDEITRWLSARALPLTTLSAGEPYEDLRPLREALKGVRIVGLGESTHGTREFFLLKHRLLEFLVREMGFRALAMEASESAALAVDAYVAGGAGDAGRLVSRLDFWTWRTHEIVAMVEWMREHNRTVPAAERVRFVGIDPQRCADSVAVVGTFLEQAAPATAESARETLRVLAASRPGARPDPARRLYEEAGELAGFLEEHRAGLAARTSPEAADDAIRHARILVRCADLITLPLEPDPGEESLHAVRDRHMAGAVDALVDATGDRVAVWAHNGHIAKGTYGAGVPALGSLLRARHGEAYYALGLLFGKGRFRARRGIGTTGPAVPHRIGRDGRSAEHRLAAAVPGDYLVDLRGGEAQAAPAVREWLRGAGFQRSFGANVPRFTYRFHLAPLVPAAEYDGLAFVAKSTCSRPLA
ncbi:erythromycin esterase family protein [Streptomyces sp. NPDC002120]|uniref:erythromycin esterase family protein n=1 Tax=Streptomyces sp. NPDC002120 TaxID=3364631 RepID=UPI003689AF2F